MKTFANCSFAPIRKSEFDFFVRSAGHFRLVRIDRGSCKKAHFPEIFWAVDGAGYFMLNGKQHLLKPGYVWYYPPGSEHFFFPAGDFFEYRWLTIDGVSARTLFEGLGFRPGARYAGECPETLFRKLELEGVLMTMFDSRTNLAMQVAEEVKRYFPGKVYATVIPRNVRLSEAPSHGKPITAYDRSSRGYEAYTALAEEFLRKSKG